LAQVILAQALRSEAVQRDRLGPPSAPKSQAGSMSGASITTGATALSDLNSPTDSTRAPPSRATPPSEVADGRMQSSESLLQQAVARACSEAVAAACGEVQAAARREVERALRSLLGAEACRGGAFPDCLLRLNALEAQAAVHQRQLEELMAGVPRGSPMSRCGGGSEASETSERRLVSLAVAEACAAFHGESHWWHREVVRLDSEASKTVGRIDALEGRLEEAARKLEVEQIRIACGKAGSELPSEVSAGLRQHLQVLQAQSDALQLQFEKETADLRRGLGEMRQHAKVKGLEDGKLSQSLEGFIKKVDKTCSEMSTPSVDVVSRFPIPSPEVSAQKSLPPAEGPKVHRAGRSPSPQRPLSGSDWVSPIMQNRAPSLAGGIASAISASMPTQVVGDTLQSHAPAEAAQQDELARACSIIAPVPGSSGAVQASPPSMRRCPSPSCPSPCPSPPCPSPPAVSGLPRPAAVSPMATKRTLQQGGGQYMRFQGAAPVVLRRQSLPSSGSSRTRSCTELSMNPKVKLGGA